MQELHSLLIIFVRSDLIAICILVYVLIFSLTVLSEYEALVGMVTGSTLHSCHRRMHR